MRPYRLETRARPRLGMVLLSSDEVLEDEARGVLEGRDVSLLHSRIAFGNDVSPARLAAMEERLPEAAGLLPEGLDAIAYACTSASVVIGPTAVARQIRAAHPGVAVTDPISAVLSALGAVGASRIALVTPYAAEVAGPMRDFLAEKGIETQREVSFGVSDDRIVARFAADCILEATLEAAAAKGVEAVFISCTNIRALGIIAAAESRLGLPVISSNLALIWDLLRMGGVAAPGWAPGRLFAQAGFSPS